MLSPRNVAIAIVALAVLAIGAFFVLPRQSSPPAIASATEEPCTTGAQGEERTGYLRTVLLCPEDSPQCQSDQVRVFRARRSGNWNAEAMLIPDIPDGDVITGGDMVDPSPYRVTSMGFNSVKVTKYENASDYCTQHYWYYLHANWISTEPSDKARITICVYYDRWPGAKPAEACPSPRAPPPH
jgi:hypothetical protein